MATADLKIVIEGVDNASRTLENIDKKTGQLGKSVDALGAAVGFDMLTSGLGKLSSSLRGPIDDAVALGESVNAVEKIFGDSAKGVLDWGDKNARAFGLSDRAFNQMATPMGAVLKNLGFSQDQVAEQTINLTKRASDMASVFNTDVGDALAAINSALRGEGNPIERYGVSVNQTAVNLRAMADTGKASAEALTENEKAAARLAIIFEQTASVEGDFADTSDQLANSQRIMNASIEEGRTELVSNFLPALQLGVSTFASLPPEVQGATAMLVELAPALGEVAIGAATIARGGPEIAKALGGMTSSAMRLAPAMLGVAAAAGAAIAANQIIEGEGPKWAGALENIIDPADRLAFALDQVDERSGELTVTELLLIEQLHKQAGASEEAEEWTAAQAVATEEAIEPTNVWEEAIESLNVDLETLTGVASGAIDAIRKFEDVPTVEMIELELAINGAERELRALERAQREGKPVTDAQIEAAESLVGSLQDEKEAMDDARQATADKAIEVGILNTGSNDLLTTEGQLAGATLNAAGAFDTQRGAANDLRISMRDLTNQARDAIAAMDAALARGDVMSAQEQYLVATGGNAAGTSYWRGGMTWVGERGPELINLPRGSQVHSNSESMAMAMEPLSFGNFASRPAPPVQEIHVHVSNQGNIYGLDDFEEVVREAVRSGLRGGYFRGELAGG